MVGLKRALRRKLEMSVPESDQRFLDDPYLRLGYGMHSYFKVLKYLMIMMLLLMLISVPLMLFYAGHDDLEHDLSEYMWN